jgi:hypothetical protein
LLLQTDDRKSRQLGSVVLFALMAMILILYVQVDIQTSYGQQQPALPSLRIKVQMDKAVIA